MISEREISARMREDEELRKRMRAVILELVPNKWGIRGTLFHLIDRAPPSALLAMRERIRELVA